MRNTLLLWLLLGLAPAWGQAPPPPAAMPTTSAAAPLVPFALEGQVRYPATGWAYLMQPGAPLDSTPVQQGRFRLSGRAPAGGLAMLLVGGSGSQRLFRRTPPPFQLLLYLEPGTVRVASPDSLAHATVAGTPLNADAQRLRTALKPVNARQQQLTARAVPPPAAEQTPAFQAAREQQFAALAAERRQIMTQFIRTNPGSPISLKALTQVAGFGRDLDPAAVGPLFEGLAPAVRQSLDGQEFAARLVEARRLGVGQLAPDFTQNDPRGRPVSLRDFRGQYVLLDFWASWCKPCRAENPALVATYQQFKSRRFTVLSVSLDQDQDKWEKAIAADGLPWTHVSDLKFEQNAVARRYGIKGVPQNLLIGPDGRILALNLHGTALSQKLATVLPAAAP